MPDNDKMPMAIFNIEPHKIMQRSFWALQGILIELSVTLRVETSTVSLAFKRKINFVTRSF
jgi:hypothetical protein